MKPFIVGITGGSGSGKTSFINRIRGALPPEAVCVISQDDYYRPIDQQKRDERGIVNFDRPKSIDKKVFRKDIERLIAGETVHRQEYTFNNRQATPKMLTFEPAPIIIVEGLFVFYYKQINALLDLRVFLQAKENLKVIRRIKRDRVERNYPLEDVLYRYENHVLPTFEKYIRPYVDEADIVINNNHGFERGSDVLIGFLRTVLEDWEMEREGEREIG